MTRAPDVTPRPGAPSTVYGGRPNFGAIRRGSGGDAELVLHELLPEEQADARRERWQRNGRTVRIQDVHDVFQPETLDDTWSWEDWSALKVARLTGPGLKAAIPTVRQALKDIDRSPDPLVTTQGGELLLPEDTGVRLALTVLGIKPLRRYDRMRAIARGVARMSTDECYYWHALCRSPNSPNGTKAFRTLLTAHID